MDFGGLNCGGKGRLGYILGAGMVAVIVSDGSAILRYPDDGWERYGLRKKVCIIIAVSSMLQTSPRTYQGSFLKYTVPLREIYLPSSCLALDAPASGPIMLYLPFQS